MVAILHMTSSIGTKTLSTMDLSKNFTTNSTECANESRISIASSGRQTPWGSEATLLPRDGEFEESFDFEKSFGYFFNKYVFLWRYFILFDTSFPDIALGRASSESFSRTSESWD